MKLNYKNKADFQAAHFGKLAEKVLGSGESGNISYRIAAVIEGLSEAWDKAEEQESFD